MNVQKSMLQQIRILMYRAAPDMKNSAATDEPLFF